MLFLRADEDFVPYTPRDKQNLHENLQGLGPGIQVESLELAIRKEVRVTDVGGGGPPLLAGRGQLIGPHWPMPTHIPPRLGRAAGWKAGSWEARGRTFFFFKILFIYLTGKYKQGVVAEAEVEAVSPLSREPDMGVDPRTPGS